MEALAYLVPLAVFLVIYAVLRRRAGERAAPAPVQAAWIAAIIGCAALVILLGVLL